VFILELYLFLDGIIGCCIPIFTSLTLSEILVWRRLMFCLSVSRLISFTSRGDTPIFYMYIQFSISSGFPHRHRSLCVKIPLTESYCIYRRSWSVRPQRTAGHDDCEGHARAPQRRPTFTAARSLSQTYGCV
jgi:hypothetical protein